MVMHSLVQSNGRMDSRVPKTGQPASGIRSHQAPDGNRRAATTRAGEDILAALPLSVQTNDSTRAISAVQATIVPTMAPAKRTSIKIVCASTSVTVRGLAEPCLVNIDDFPRALLAHRSDGTRRLVERLPPAQAPSPARAGRRQTC